MARRLPAGKQWATVVEPENAGRNYNGPVLAEFSETGPNCYLFG